MGLAACKPSRGAAIRWQRVVVVRVDISRANSFPGKDRLAAPKLHSGLFVTGPQHFT